MLLPITSPQNPQIKRMVKLRQAKERRATGTTRVDGARELLRALDAGLVPETVFLCEDLLRSDEARRAVERSEAEGATLQPVDPRVYEKLQFGDRDEGLAATLRWHPAALAEARLGESPLVVLLEGIEKPGNLGAILRSADGAGVDAVVLVDAAIDATNPNAIRASLGTIFTVGLHTATADEAAAWLVEQGLVLHAAVAQDSTPYTQVAYPARTALLLGSEHHGLSAAWRARADRRIHIPMRGAADSLNVSTAAAILLFEVVRQRDS